MRFQQDGTPIIQTPQDVTIADGFAEKLADNLYGRLPKFVKMFLSKDAFTALLRNAIGSIASKKPSGSMPRSSIPGETSSDVRD